MLTVELSIVQAVNGANRIQAQQAAGFCQCGKINEMYRKSSVKEQRRQKQTVYVQCCFHNIE